MKIYTERIRQLSWSRRRNLSTLLKDACASLSTCSQAVDKSSKLTGVSNAYNSVDFEESISERWKQRKRRDGTEFPLFRMALPPPNITGKLHLGHALTVAIQDSIARLKLMTGSNVEWIPGFDHAGIATHSVVQRKLTLSGKPTLEAEALSSELKNFAKLNQENITKQLKLLGALLDWEKTYYTMDEKYSEAVREAFIHLFENGTISRGDEIVNWCCELKSTISDIEVDQVQFTGKTSFKVPGYDHPIDFGLLYFCAYQLENSDQSIIVATSRPETMFGDVAVAVHPSHPMYSKFIGSRVVNPVNGHLLPVIEETRVKLDFGTGALKVTPAHDKVDFAIGRSQNLPAVKILAPDGTLNESCGEFKGLRRFIARFEVVNFLTKKGALKDIREYNGSIGLCSRSKDIIEPVLLPHWFLKTQLLSESIKKAVENGEIVIRPDNQKQILLNTLTQAHDWCLSRQIQWGHPIPAYFHINYPDKWVAAQNMESAVTKLKEKLGSNNVNIEDVRQDKDVLDTWFSSAIVPLVLNDWPNYLELKPIFLMETGHDILVFWVWRMLMMGLALTDKFPFNNVLLHGVVRDHYGRKMSKSLGNVIDPLHIINGIAFKDMMTEAKTLYETGELTEDEYKLKISGIKKDYPSGFISCGADGLRFALLAQDISAESVKLDTEYLENCKHFCNKLWQAMRFYLLHQEEGINHPIEIASPIECLGKLSLSDRWILSCLHDFVQEYEEAVVKCQFHIATEAIRTFILLNYCDVYLELIKKDIQEGNQAELHMMVMRYAFCTGLKLAHPFLPFVTEEIWFRLTNNGAAGLLVDQTLPSTQEVAGFQNEKIQELMKIILRITKEIRHFRVKFLQGIKNPQFHIETDREDIDLRQSVEEIQVLTKAKIDVGAFGDSHTPDMMTSIFELNEGGNCRVAFPRANIVKLSSGQPAFDAEKLLKLQSKAEKIRKQMANPLFQQFAAPETKAKLKRTLESIEDKINRARGSGSVWNFDNNSRDRES